MLQHKYNDNKYNKIALYFSDIWYTKPGMMKPILLNYKKKEKDRKKKRNNEIVKINYVPDIQHIIRWSPVMIYKCVDSACPLFLVFRHLSARKMFVCYIKIIACAFPTRPHVIYAATNQICL